MEHTAVLPQPESPVDAEPAPGAEVSPAEEPPETDSAEPVAAATIALQAPEPVDVDPDDPVASLAAIQAAAVGPDGQPFEPPGGPPGAPAAPSAPSARHEAVPENAEPDADAHDPDVTLPPPVSEAVLADVRSAEVTDSRGSLVDAKLCANGHANPPTAATCGVCAEFLAPGASAVVHVPRPGLGRLQLDDGELVELDQELLIGRNPDRDQDPARASLRRVKTLGDKVSRSHLEVRFQGWDVLVSDSGSTNGTFVVPHPGGQVVVLEPGRPQMIDAGAVVYFGSRSFTMLGREESA
jgi:hypothetical protein